MLRHIWAICLKDLKILFKDRTGMITLFAMPMMFILVMSVALKNVYDADGHTKPVDVLVVDQDLPVTTIDGHRTRLAGDVIAALGQVTGLNLVTTFEGKPLTRSRAESLVAGQNYQMAVVFPEQFSAGIINIMGNPDTVLESVVFIRNPSTGLELVAPVQAAITAYANRIAAYAQAPLRMKAALTKAAESLPPDQAPFAGPVIEVLREKISAAYNTKDIDGEFEVTIEEAIPAQFNITRFPTAIEQNVPGYTILGVFFIIQVLATSLLKEKQEGTFRRLLVAPISRPALLLGKLLPYYLVNLIQVTLMFAVGALVFGMSLGHSMAALVVVTLAMAAAATGMGLLVATFGKTPEQISGISVLLALTLAALGGMMVPTIIMPAFMQTLSKISPHAWALSAYQDVIVRGLGVKDVLPETGVLLGFALLFFGIASWRFRFD